MLGQRRRFTQSFKAEAVQMSEEPGRSVASVARELDIYASQLSKWRREYFKEQNGSADKNVSTTTTEEELRQLKRQLADVTEERDILKKAIAVFSKRTR